MAELATVNHKACITKKDTHSASSSLKNSTKPKFWCCEVTLSFGMCTFTAAHKTPKRSIGWVSPLHDQRRVVMGHSMRGTILVSCCSARHTVGYTTIEVEKRWREGHNRSTSVCVCAYRQGLPEQRAPIPTVLSPANQSHRNQVPIDSHQHANAALSDERASAFAVPPFTTAISLTTTNTHLPFRPASAH